MDLDMNSFGQGGQQPVFQQSAPVLAPEYSPAPPPPPPPVPPAFTSPGEGSMVRHNVYHGNGMTAATRHHLPRPNYYMQPHYRPVN